MRPFSSVVIATDDDTEQLLACKLGGRPLMHCYDVTVCIFRYVMFAAMHACEQTKYDYLQGGPAKVKPIFIFDGNIGMHR